MSLTDEQTRSFERDGYLAPLKFCSPEQMRRLRSAIESALDIPGPHGGDRWSARHQDCRVVYDICASSEIVESVATLLGPDLILWNSVFINKEPGSSEVPWHQDRDFLLLESDVSLAVWLAVDDATVENGCLEVIPGSHSLHIPHIPRSRPDAFDACVDNTYVNPNRSYHVELKAGQFMIFQNKLLHYSGANLSHKRRMGLAIRYTVPGIKIKVDKFFEGYRVYLVRGCDPFKSNSIDFPPQT